MLLFNLKSLLLGVSLASTIVSALPFPSYSSEVDVTEREYDELLPRANTLFAKLKPNEKKHAIDFVKSIPHEHLKLTGGGQRTLYKADAKNQKVHHNSGIDHGHRLDFQGMTSGGYHNLQIQKNGDHKGKSTVGGIQVKGNWSPNRIRKELVHSISHPVKDKHGNEYLRKHGLGPINPQAKKGGAKEKKTTDARKAQRQSKRDAKKKEPGSKWARKEARMQGSPRKQKQGKK